MMTHDEAWDRIPWLVNGRADESEREQLEAHLRVCEECRIEVAVQRQVMGAIANDKRIDVVPGAAFQRLWERISADSIVDDDEREWVTEEHPSPAVSHARAPDSADRSAARSGASETAVSPSRNRSITRWLAAAVIVEAVGLMALTAANYQPADLASGQPPAEYRTVTSPASQATSRGTIRAVFQPTLRMSDLQQLLERSGLQIVSGPTEAGVYTLAASRTEDQAKVATALSDLRAHPSVRFAEPVGK